MAIGRKTGGRQKGTKNKRTVELERQRAEAEKALHAALGDDLFEGDAHALLMAIYKNKKLPMDLRADCAKVAIRFEKPALASTDNTNRDTRRYVVALPNGETSLDEWKAKYSPAEQPKMQ
jgi:hypothetical protein